MIFRSYGYAAGLLLVLTICITLPAAAQGPPPSPEEVLGYELGTHFTDAGSVLRYSRGLADASPRVMYRSYGVTPEQRTLHQLVIASPEHLARLDAILADNAELTRAGTTAARAREIVARTPAIIYFSYGVHGNESSSSEAAMWTAWDLARGAPEVAGVLDSLVVIMDPVANPDGRDRYVNWFRTAVGSSPNADPQSREHREPWPGGRFNHYLFDLNRDWAWATQPETRARLATWWQWNPQVHVDFHEMSPQSTYFFFPAAAPVNPIYPDHVMSWARRIGEANARAFDQHGWTYFTGESYDLLYPGYGDSWPSLHGAIGMTYEQAGGGSAGIEFERSDGDTLTLRLRATQHRTAGHATLRAASSGKSNLMLGFAEAHRTAGVGHPDVLLVPDATGRIEALVEHLQLQGIEVERAFNAFGAASTAYPGFESRREFPAGTYRVRMRQPRGRLAATLLQPETELRAEYSYDISAWALPYAYGVEAHQTNSTPSAAWSVAQGREPAGVGALPETRLGYLVPADQSGSAAVVRFMKAGGNVNVLRRSTTIGGREWAAGSWFLAAGRNPQLVSLATQAGLGGIAVPVSSGLADSGIDLGSANAAAVRTPRIALVGGDGVTPTSYGAHWFYLEERLGLQVSRILAGDLERLDLSRYEVLIVPDAATRVFPEATRTVLRSWVESGGRLVAVAGGAEALSAVAGVSMRESVRPDTSETDRERFLITRDERTRRNWIEEVPGAILQLRLDPSHPVAWGAAAHDGDRLFVLHEGTRVFEPSAAGETIASFGTSLRATSGVISASNLQRLEQGSWAERMRVGRGSVVLFAGDPLFRMFWTATHPLYLNAILLGGM
ncbi:M14 family metallopeptidase [soil metagenome]